VAVADGDTLTILDAGRQQRRIRLAEIDAPEKRRQPFGQRSKQSLSDLCYGRDAVIEDGRRDRYGRTIGRVSCAGIDANAEQVRRGMAWVFAATRPTGASTRSRTGEGGPAWPMGAIPSRCRRGNTGLKNSKCTVFNVKNMHRFRLILTLGAALAAENYAPPRPPRRRPGRSRPPCAGRRPASAWPGQGGRSAWRGRRQNSSSRNDPRKMPGTNGGTISTQGRGQRPEGLGEPPQRPAQQIGQQAIEQPERHGQDEAAGGSRHHRAAAEPGGQADQQQITDDDENPHGRARQLW
jgi:hypothetical protein